MIKYESRKQQREVTELMNDLLYGIKHYLTEENKKLVNIALNILNNTDVEGVRK